MQTPTNPTTEQQYSRAKLYAAIHRLRNRLQYLPLDYGLNRDEYETRWQLRMNIHRAIADIIHKIYGYD